MNKHPFLSRFAFLQRFSLLLMTMFMAIVLVACGGDKIVGISVTSPTKTTYYIGETLDLNGMVVSALKKDETTAVLNSSDYTVSGFDSTTAASLTITVTYLTFTDTFDVTIVEDQRNAVSTTKVVVYDGPTIMDSSDAVSITVEDEPLFVYETLVNHGRLFTFLAPTTTTPVALFDFEGHVDIEIAIHDDTVTSAVVRPLSYGITPTIADGKIRFSLDYPANYTIEYNGNTERAIHLFANPIETNTPDPANLPADMLYIGPGVYKADAIPLHSNMTVYVAGGAVVYGQFRTEGLTNVTIRGRGIIDGSIYPRTKASEATIPVELRHSSNITIEGLTFLNPAGWTIHAYFVENLVIDNIKIVTARANGDGISIQSSSNVLVKNSFVRAWDDALVVKNMNRGITDGVHFYNNIVWTDLAQSMEVGYETYGATMNDITFENITVLHNFHKAAMSIHNADDAAITDVVFKNITIEDAQMTGDNKTETYDNFLIDMFIQYNQEWSHSGGVRGTIEGVSFDNIVVLDGMDDLNTRILGYDATHKISDVSFTNVNYIGTPVNDMDDINVGANGFVDTITYAYSGTPTGAELIAPYVLDLSDELVDLSVQPNITQMGFIVPDFAIVELPTSYVGAKVDANFTTTATHGTTALVWDDGSGDWIQEGASTSAVVDEDFDTIWYGDDWQQVTGEFAALNIDFGESRKIGAIRVYGDIDSNIYLTQSIAVYGVRSTSTTNVYSKLLNSIEYEFTPAKGNYVDIKLSPGEFKAIQLRFYNKEGAAYADRAFASEVEFYPASLTFGKSITATPHEDVYEAVNLTDGSVLTYYESDKGTWPAVMTIDMGATYQVKYINMYLPPLMQWTARTQTIQILGSSDNSTFTEVVASTGYLFDPASGNTASIILNEAASMRYIRFVVTANSSLGGEAAQLSEISVYE